MHKSHYGEAVFQPQQAQVLQSRLAEQLTMLCTSKRPYRVDVRLFGDVTLGHAGPLERLTRFGPAGPRRHHQPRLVAHQARDRVALRQLLKDHLGFEEHYFACDGTDGCVKKGGEIH